MDESGADSQIDTGAKQSPPAKDPSASAIKDPPKEANTDQKKGGVEKIEDNPRDKRELREVEKELEDLKRKVPSSNEKESKEIEALERDILGLPNPDEMLEVVDSKEDKRREEELEVLEPVDYDAIGAEKARKIIGLEDMPKKVQKSFEPYRSALLKKAEENGEPHFLFFKRAAKWPTEVKLNDENDLLLKSFVSTGDTPYGRQLVDYHIDFERVHHKEGSSSKEREWFMAYILSFKEGQISKIELDWDMGNFEQLCKINPKLASVFSKWCFPASGDTYEHFKGTKDRECEIIVENLDGQQPEVTIKGKTRSKESHSNYYDSNRRSFGSKLNFDGEVFTRELLGDWDATSDEYEKDQFSSEEFIEFLKSIYAIIPTRRIEKHESGADSQINTAGKNNS